MVASPEERDLHSPLVTAHPFLLFSLPRPISRFLRGNSLQEPTESSWSSSPVSMSTGRSSVPPVFALSLLRSYKGLTVGDQSNVTSILPSSQLPRRLLCRHGLRLKRAVSGSRCGYPRAQLVSSLLHHHTSISLRLLPGRTRVKDTPLLFRLLSARCSRGISTMGSKTFWHLCLQLSLFVLCLTSLWATSLLLAPLAAPSIYHTAAATSLSANVSSHASCMTASVGILLSVPDIILVGLSWVRSSLSVGFRDPGTPCRRCILQQAFLGRSVDETRCPRDQPKSAPARRIRRLFLGASLLVMLSCLS